MNLTFTPAPIPELTVTGSQLATLGFTTGTALQLTLRTDGLWVTTVTDEATWAQLCYVSQHRPDLGADWVRENGELVIAGSWLTDAGITDAEQLELTTAPGILHLRRREEGRFRA